MEAVPALSAPGNTPFVLFAADLAFVFCVLDTRFLLNYPIFLFCPAFAVPAPLAIA
jgi:hypothetical protein